MNAVLADIITCHLVNGVFCPSSYGIVTVPRECFRAGCKNHFAAGRQRDALCAEPPVEIQGRIDNGFAIFWLDIIGDDLVLQRIVDCAPNRPIGD